MPALYVDVIIPLAVKDTYTYLIPARLETQVQFGLRLEVPFGSKKIYAGLAIKIHDQKPQYDVRKVLSIIDDRPVITRPQLDLWKWMANYYLCDLGEVMYAAMPSKLKLQSETLIKPGKQLDEQIFDLNDQEFMIAEAVSIQREITIDQIRSILNIKTVYPIIKRLLDLEVIEVNEELSETFKPKTIIGVRLAENFRNKESQDKIFDLVKRSDHQTRAMLVILQQQNQTDMIGQQEVIRLAEVSHNVLAALEKKGIIERYEQVVSRIPGGESEISDHQPLTERQKEVLMRVETMKDSTKPLLLHGVTGSGKTRIYIELMKKTLARGRQVLYLLPEIALTTQIVQRLKKSLGEHLLVYHSRINDQQRVEVWKEIMELPKIVLAARSGVFLPFDDLGLVIVDEEHDPSYKQEEPNPRYQARDTAIVLGKLHGAITLLGSATPAVESFWNAEQGKYNYLGMPERYGNIEMPEIVLIDMKKGSRSGHLSNELIDGVRKMKEEGYQTILFQNRRGFAPLLMCTTCGWTTACKNCDTTLTYHQFSNQMQCHLCGYHEKPAIRCPACGNPELTLKGFGTEMIEEEVKILLPDHQVARLDLDTARGKKQLERILYQFETGQIDVLIGTQMISKGLDFEKVGLVGVISADHLMHYPDFRASERAFQLMLQVGGRSGRKHRRGQVLIQALHTSHPILEDVLSSNYRQFYDREIVERKTYGFPPFSRLIILTIKHIKSDRTNAAADAIAKFLRDRLGSRVHGPVTPSIARIRNRYLSLVVIKLEKKASLITQCKNWIEQAELQIKKKKGFSTLRISINVDP